MQDAPLVRMMHGPGDLGDEPGAFVLGHPLCAQFQPLQPRGKTAARDILHREVRPAFVFADFMDRHDVRMFEAGDRLGFGAEAFHLRFARQPGLEHHLQRDDAVEAGLARAINHPHAAACDFIQQFVIVEEAERAARCRCLVRIGPEQRSPQAPGAQSFRSAGWLGAFADGTCKLRRHRFRVGTFH